ncbi:MAG: hypothetical protein KGL39_46620, partial [Patescibacteria group bacterium]|nr:hypothetical protein [Patescibacteria group bacterium]
PTVRCVFVLQEGTRISRDCPAIQREQIEVKYVSRAEVDTFVKGVLERFPTTPDRAVSQAAMAKYERFQAECAEALWNAGDRDTLLRPIRAKLPTGVGKSYVIARLAEMHSDEDDRAIIIEPRVVIVRELAELLRRRGLDVHTVSEGSAWEDGHGVYVVSGASARKIPNGTVAAAVIIDEAHYELGHADALKRVQYGVRYDLSATLEGKGFDYEMRYEDAITQGFICDVRYVFVAFSANPEFRDIAAHLVEHPEHRSVLACFQEKKSAERFVREYNRLDAGQALAFTSNQRDLANLEAFRAGRVRVLAVVTRVEMGVNVHAIDTVLLAEPWESAARVRQLCGRGSRWHPAKGNYFSILQCVGPELDAENKKLLKIHDFMQGDNARDVIDRVELVPGVGHQEHVRRCKARAAAADAEAGEADGELLAKVRERVFNRLLAQIGASPEEMLRFEYKFEKAILRRFRLRDRAAYLAWVAAHGATSFKRDPPKHYARIFPRFSWSDYLGRDVLGLEEIRGLVREIAESATGDVAEAIGTFRPGDEKDLYDLLCAHDDRLPRDLGELGVKHAAVFVNL